MPLIQLAQITAQATKENTWNAINAVQEAPPGVADIEFTFCYFEDVTTEIGYENDEFPVDIPLGHDISGNYGAQNVGDVALKVRLYVELIDPDGIVRSSGWSSSTPFTVNPGVNMASKSFSATLDKLGLWQIYGRIEYDLA